MVEGDIRIGAEIGGDLLGLGFLDVQFAGFEVGVRGNESGLDLFPGQGRAAGLGESSAAETDHRQNSAPNTP